MTRERIVIVLEPMPDTRSVRGGAPVDVRLRRLLKLALRVCGLRAVEVRRSKEWDRRVAVLTPRLAPKGSPAATTTK